MPIQSRRFRVDRVSAQSRPSRRALEVVAATGPCSPRPDPSPRPDRPQGPIFIILASMIFVNIYVHLIGPLRGDVHRLVAEARASGVPAAPLGAAVAGWTRFLLPPAAEPVLSFLGLADGDAGSPVGPWWPSAVHGRAWRLLGSFSALSLILTRVVPGKAFRGPRTPGGHVPIYPANGLECYALTLLILGLLWRPDCVPLLGATARRLGPAALRSGLLSDASLAAAATNAADALASPAASFGGSLARAARGAASVLLPAALPLARALPAPLGAWSLRVVLSPAALLRGLASASIGLANLLTAPGRNPLPPLPWHPAHGLWDPAEVYALYPEIISGLSLFSIPFVALLTIKGLVAPSTPDNGTTGSLLGDFWWGTELHPRVLGWDVKTFTNCRFGMMGWAVTLLCFGRAQYLGLGGHLSSGYVVSALLQLLYITKFFAWETGYFASMDIAHDRAGYYLCWGCLVWVPAIYASPGYSGAARPSDLPTPMAVAWMALGVGAVLLNYWADAQRYAFRQAAGKGLVWGKKPEFITATYTDELGVKRTSLLLCSGFWGVARHVHYVFELTAAAAWAGCQGGTLGLVADGNRVDVATAWPYLPAFLGRTMGNWCLAQWFYPAFLALLLFDRSVRDDARCAAKYGAHWDEYRRRVPYKIIPGVF